MNFNSDSHKGNFFEFFPKAWLLHVLSRACPRILSMGPAARLLSVLQTSNTENQPNSWRLLLVSQARLLTTSWCHADPNHFPSRSMWSDTFTTIPSLCLPVAGVHNCFETSYADSATVDLCSLLRDLKSSSL